MAGVAIEAVRERTDIVDLIGAKVRLRQAGRNLKGLCPFHEEKTPSFVVYPESQSYHCFGCGKSGDAFSFIMDTENLDFSDTLKLLAARAGVELESQRPQRRDPEIDRERARLIELNERAASYFTNLLWTSPAGSSARAVLEQRGVDRPTADRFGLGFAPDSFDALKSHFLAREIDEQDMLAAGLLTKNENTGRTYDRFRNRLTFPIRNRDGRVVGFGARALGDEKPKYLNSPQTPIFDKRSILYGLDKAYDTIRRERSMVIVEGYMDAIAAHQCGYENVVASMGTAITPNQVASIRRYLDRVYLALDSDTAGQMATLRGIDSMRESFVDDSRVEVSANRMIRFERTLGAEIRIVVLPEGKDPDEFIRAHPDAWPEALKSSVPLVEYYLTHALADIDRSPNARANALRDIAVPILLEIGDAEVLTFYVDLTARLLGYGPDGPEEVRRSLRRNVSPPATRVHQPQASRRDGLTIDRPLAVDPERFVVGVILNYPMAGVEGLSHLRREDVIDARHRVILEQLAIAQGNFDVAMQALPDELADYARDLQTSLTTETGEPPRPSAKEIPNAIRRLAKARNDDRLRQLRVDLADAKRSGDTAAVEACTRQITDLTTTMPNLAPDESPYFRDLRSDQPVIR